MRQAIAASHAYRPDEPVDWVSVEGHDRIYVYVQEPLPTYNDIRRIRGKWRCVGGYMIWDD